MKFSDRIGVTKPKQAIQKEGMDDDLRNALWNACTSHFFFIPPHESFLGEVPKLKAFYHRLWHDFFKSATDTLDSRIRVNIATVRKWFFSAQWHEVYNFLEYLAHELVSSGIDVFHRLLQRHSGA